MSYYRKAKLPRSGDEPTPEWQVAHVAGLRAAYDAGDLDLTIRPEHPGLSLLLEHLALEIERGQGPRAPRRSADRAKR